MKTIEELQQEKIELLESLVIGHQLTEAALYDEIDQLKSMIELYEQAVESFKSHLDRRQRDF